MSEKLGGKLFALFLLTLPKRDYLHTALVVVAVSFELDNDVNVRLRQIFRSFVLPPLFCHLLFGCWLILV